MDEGRQYGKKYEKHLIQMDTSKYRVVIDAMANVPRIGTAIRYGPYFKAYQICGKTGTAQNPHGEDHSVFISFAPKYNPKIAVAAVIENAGQGAHWAAPICFLVTEYYLSEAKPSEGTRWIEDIIIKGVYHPKVIKRVDEITIVQEENATESETITDENSE